jgi:hypothetical protein
MPGLSFVYDFRGDVPQGESTLVTSLDRLLHYDDYEKKVLLSTKFYFIACTKYKEYPLVRFEDEKFLIYLEGKILVMRIMAGPFFTGNRQTPTPFLMGVRKGGLCPLG